MEWSQKTAGLMSKVLGGLFMTMVLLGCLAVIGLLMVALVEILEALS